jgi:ligand-binding sensor domain-containing protein
LNALSTNEGLPSNHIYDIVEDNKGFLWLATDNGISRFDGRYFQNFSVRDGLPSNDILQVLKSPDGTIWVNAYKQTPAYFDEINNKFITYQGNKQLTEMSKSLLGMTGMADGTIRFHNDLGIVFLKNKRVSQQRGKNESFFTIL